MEEHSAGGKNSNRVINASYDYDDDDDDCLIATVLNRVTKKINRTQSGST
jgi:hypothetical protein